MIEMIVFVGPKMPVLRARSHNKEVVTGQTLRAIRITNSQYEEFYMTGTASFAATEIFPGILGMPLSGRTNWPLSVVHDVIMRTITGIC